MSDSRHRRETASNAKNLHGAAMDELPAYTELSEEELKEMEDEFGRVLSPELALWFIRNRANREAVERMLKTADSDADHASVIQPETFPVRARHNKMLRLRRKCA